MVQVDEARIDRISSVDLLAALKRLCPSIRHKPGSTELLQLLIARKDRIVRMSTILDVLYGHREDGGPEAGVKIVHVLICRLRQRYPQYRITSVWGVGYRLEDANGFVRSEQTA